MAPGSLKSFLGEEEQIQPPAGVIHFVLNSLHLGVEIAVGKKTGDGDEETEGGGDQTLGNTAGDGRGRTQFVPAHHAEGVHHAHDRAEQSEQRGGGDDGVEDRQTAGEALDFQG